MPCKKGSRILSRAAEVQGLLRILPSLLAATQQVPLQPSRAPFSLSEYASSLQLIS